MAGGAVLDADVVRALKVLSQNGTLVRGELSLNFQICGAILDQFKRLIVVRAGETVCRFDVHVWRQLFELSFLEKNQEEAPGWRISRYGRVCLKRTLSHVHDDVSSKSDDEGSFGTCAQLSSGSRDVGDSPLAWLRRRKDRSGRSLIDEHQFIAGERLREDFFKGQMGANITTNWSCAHIGGGRSSGFRDKEMTMQESAVLARERVRGALSAVGPELSGVLVDVCCYLKKLSEAERSAGLPQRSGKVVLGLALTSLARHYGLIGAVARASARRSAVMRHWGSDGYRPAIDGLDESAG